MTNKALLGRDLASRRVTIFAEEDGKTFIEMQQDCGPVIEAAKILAEVPPDKETGWRFIALIPEIVMNTALLEGWFHDKKRWREWANSADNRGFNGGRSNAL